MKEFEYKIYKEICVLALETMGRIFFMPKALNSELLKGSENVDLASSAPWTMNSW